MGERAFLAEDAVYSKAQGYESLLCRDMRGPEPWQLSDIIAASCFLREAEAIHASVHMISDMNTHRFKCFQAGALQRRYLLTGNLCGLEESSAGNGDAVSNLILFLFTGGWMGFC